ncbi:MAG: hypothetical protein H7338_19555 [Candidatus Sericytochromatia bacterium]|nr:hypothetical protein [Candidatus Sericytochromatia bacterium]
MAQAPQDASGNVTLVVPPGYERYDVLSAVVRLNPWLAPTAQLLGHILPGITAAL